MPRKETPSSPEQKNLLPPTSIKIILSPHTAAEHATGLQQHLSANTLFIPELSGWDDHTVELLRQVAMGEVPPVYASVWINGEESRTKHFIIQLAKELHNTQTQVLLVDTQKQDANHQAFDAHQMGIAYASEFTTTLERARLHLAEYLELQNQREWLMVERLLAGLKKTPAEAHQIVMTLGSFHTGIVEKLQQKSNLFSSLEIDAVAPFANLELPSFEDEALELVKTNQPVSDELVARIVLERLMLGGQLEKQLYEVFKDGVKITEYVKSLVAQFSSAEIEAFYQSLVTQYQQQVSDGEFMAIGDDESGEEGDVLLGLNWLASEMLLGTSEEPGLLATKGIKVPKQSEHDRYRDLYDFQG